MFFTALVLCCKLVLVICSIITVRAIQIADLSRREFFTVDSLGSACASACDSMRYIYNYFITNLDQSVLNMRRELVKDVFGEQTLKDWKKKTVVL